MNCWVIRIKVVCTTLNNIKHFLTLVFTVIVCIFVSAFASLGDYSKGPRSLTIGLNICTVIARIRLGKY